MSTLDPTYLRYIYDNLIKGIVHPDNAPELPDGLIGLYEEAFEEHLPVMERQLLLKRFTLFALLKKEVSAAFVAEIMEEREDVVLEFINTYSSWFNSPEPGKFQLYHERLKVYLLQKLGDGEVKDLHEKLISRLEKAIKEQREEEFEWYGLEFIGQYYSVLSKVTTDFKISENIYKVFYKLQISKKVISRQKKLSNSYQWSKNNLRLLSELGIIHNSNLLFKLSDLVCEIHNEEFNIIEKVEKMLFNSHYEDVLKLVSNLQENELELIELKAFHYLFILTVCNDYDYIKKVSDVLEDYLTKHNDDLFIETLIPSPLILSLCIKINSVTLNSEYIFSRCENWKEDTSGILNPIKDLNEEKKEIIQKKIDSIKLNTDFIIDESFTNELSKEILTNSINSIKTEIINRNDHFYSSNNGVELQIRLNKNINTWDKINLIESLDNFTNESELFHYLMINQEKFNSSHANSILNCIQSVKNSDLKNILIEKFWEILILNTNSIEEIYNVSHFIFAKKLLSINIQVLKGILSISFSQKLKDLSKYIVDLRTHDNFAELFDTSFCYSYNNSIDLNFLYLDYLFTQDQLKHFYHSKYIYFIELFDSNEDSNLLYYNIDVIKELVSFCVICKEKCIDYLDKLLSKFIEKIQNYDQYDVDQILFFLIDEMNRKELFVESYQILNLIKIPLIQKVTLIKSFSKWAFFKNLSTSFKSEMLSIIRKEHREFIIMGWLGLSYSSHQCHVDNELPDIPNSVINQNLFLENQLFIINRPDIIKVFAFKLINVENQTEKLKSYFPFLLNTNKN